jgi:FkbM family methyltransferase
MKYSIIIPTYNHCYDNLKPCLDSIIKFSNPDDIEILVVANGCIDDTEKLLQSYDQVKTFVYDEPLGYPKANNVAIVKAEGEYIILLNDDTVILGSDWLDILERPFLEDNKCGLTGPAKFTWDCAGNTCEAIGFWCVCIKREVFDRVGLLDEEFSPGMGEDGDLCVKAVQAGYTIYQVPVNEAREFGTGISNQVFPIFHKGSSTFLESETKRDIIERNKRLLEYRYGLKKYTIVIPTYNNCDKFLKPCIESLLKYTTFEDKDLIILANGCTDNTTEYLESLPSWIVKINISEPLGCAGAANFGISTASTDLVLLMDNDCLLLPQEPNDWFKRILSKFSDERVAIASPFVHKHPDFGIVAHAGCTMYRKSLLGNMRFDTTEFVFPGILTDIDLSMRVKKAGYIVAAVTSDGQPLTDNSNFDFPIYHPSDGNTYDRQGKDEPKIAFNHKLLYERYVNNMTPKYSIIIPTYNHCDDLLKPAIDSILKYTDVDLIELVICANGCVDNTADYLQSLKKELGEHLKICWSDEGLGFTKATNMGLRAAKGEFLVFLNNDIELLPQERNSWLKLLSEPMENDWSIGMTGPLMMHDDYADRDVVIFFCAAISRQVYEKIGDLDEIYTPGGGEDIDYSARMEDAGYRNVIVPYGTQVVYDGEENVGQFPIWHKNNQTFKHIDEYANYVIKRNGYINAKRYNKNIKLNLGSGGVHVPGYLSVDLNDRRTHILMDARKLEFDDNSIEEILASHLFEHINPYQSVDTLKHWLHKLKPGGKLIMEVPDIEKLCKAFTTATKEERYGYLNCIYGAVNTTAEGEAGDITAPHLWGWYPEMMYDHLSWAGYTDIQIMDEQIPHPGFNFRVEARKSLVDEIPWFERLDPVTYNEIVAGDVYQMKHKMRGKTIIDIGANIGMFSVLAAANGAKEIHCMEAQKYVFDGLIENIAMSGYTNIKPFHLAIYDEDGKTVRIENQNVGSHISDHGDEVTTITLQSFLEMAGCDKRNDLILKMDCEGAEYPSLCTASDATLRHFETIVIELHGEQDFYKVRSKLLASGFECEYCDTNFWVMVNGRREYNTNICVEKWNRK